MVPLVLRPWLLLVGLLAAVFLLPRGCRVAWEGHWAQLQAPLQLAYGQVADLRDYAALQSASKEELLAVNRDLARVNQAYALDQQRVAALEAEIARLESLLGLPAEGPFRYEIARVAQRDYTVWWERLVIRKGANHGLAEGQAVVYGGGVAGKIRSVTATTAVVELASSPGFRMAASLTGVASPVTYQGVPNVPLQPPLGVVLNVPPEVSLASGGRLRVESSRLGGVFPAGLLIGEVQSLEVGSDGYFQRGQVVLPVALGTLREVAVIVPFDLAPAP